MTKRKRPDVGDVVEIPLRGGAVAWGRMLEDAAIAIYKVTPEDLSPPIGRREYEFVVGIYDDQARRLVVVDHDPGASAEENWPPPNSVTDPINGRKRIYYRGQMRPSSDEECEGPEPAAVWDLDHIISRIEEARTNR